MEHMSIVIHELLRVPKYQEQFILSIWAREENTSGPHTKRFTPEANDSRFIFQMVPQHMKSVRQSYGCLQSLLRASEGYHFAKLAPIFILVVPGKKSLPFSGSPVTCMLAITK